jgi:hypothetical protein
MDVFSLLHHSHRCSDLSSRNNSKKNSALGVSQISQGLQLHGASQYVKTRAHAVLVLAVGQQTHLGPTEFACPALLAKLLSTITTEHWCYFIVSSSLYQEMQWGVLQRTVFINKIWMLHRTQMLKRTRRYTIGQCSTRVRMTCRAFPL